MRRALVRFHRLVVPMREAVSSLMRREHAAVAEELYPYFQDVYDHILRVSESTDSLRDLVSTIVETNLSLRDYRQNLIVKKVTSWAAIIAVPTLVTGYYGMNVPYPGFGQHLGFLASTLLMVVACSPSLPGLPPTGLALTDVGEPPRTDIGLLLLDTAGAALWVCRRTSRSITTSSAPGGPSRGEPRLPAAGGGGGRSPRRVQRRRGLVKLGGVRSDRRSGRPALLIPAPYAAQFGKWGAGRPVGDGRNGRPSGADNRYRRGD